MEREVKKHPSYGMLQIGRATGRCDDLFATTIEHNSTIRLRLYSGEEIRNLNTNYYHTDKILAEIEMSALQWAEAISNMNSAGTPCTLRYINKEKIDGVKINNERVKIDKEFKDKVVDINKTSSKLIEEAHNLLSLKNMKVSDKQNLIGVLNKLHQDLNSNIPYMKELFTEQMDKTVSEAKCEVESFIQHKINSLGLESLGQLKIERIQEE